MQGSSQPLHHIILNNQGVPEKFTTPKSGGRQFQFKPRDRQQHGQMLKDQLQEVVRKAQERTQLIPIQQVVEKGSYIEFESDPDYALKVESLKDARQGIKLVAVSEANETKEGKTPMKATVFVPEGKIGYFIKKVEQYLTQEAKKSKKPRHQEFAESVSAVRLATLKSLWTDSGEFPEKQQEIWWELWLRTEGPEEQRAEIVRKVREQASEAKLKTSENELVFPDTTVLLIRATPEQLGHSLLLLNALAEIRRAKELAEFFTALKYTEQHDWVKEALSRISEPGNNAPAVCLIDTGVNQEHPLLSPALNERDMDSYRQDWGKADNDGHGTELAGLGLYGDLTEMFLSSGSIQLHHRLESVKIRSDRRRQDHQPELYGKVTTECMARADIFAPNRKRTYCLATSATDTRDRGRPSSWSSAIDQYVSGVLEEDKPRRLIVIAAGNADPHAPGEYPIKNLNDAVHDPGQAWNAVTIGAYTEKDAINPDTMPGWMPIAPKGGLCPTSTTSHTWIGTSWPYKPDVVFEGGNMATHPKESGPDFLDSLQLLTTHKDWRSRLLTVTGDTSGATALAARMCAQIMATYPNFWPETIRGLLIHSAEWTSAMCSFAQQWPTTKQEVEPVLRIYGYGVPRLAQALYSARNSLTLIAQDSIQPFFKEGDDIKTKEMNLHELPWPKEILAALGEAVVEMRVTLSYFIEPKPERNEVKRPSRYMSHGLRFETKAPTETLQQFRQRINKAAREGSTSTTSSDADKWLIGPNLRSRGSLHSDIWRGTAVELAQKGHLAVYPVSGWWKELRSKHKYNSTSRYSLVVTIKTSDENVDIYTPVSNLISV